MGVIATTGRKRINGALSRKSADSEIIDFGAYSEGARRILLTAEELFGEHGINGVSLRQILAAAGQSNKGSVYQHFGSKERLIFAIFEMRLPSLEKARQERLLAAQGLGPPSIQTLLAALLLPFTTYTRAKTRRSVAQFHLQLFFHLSGRRHPIETWHKDSPVGFEIISSLRELLIHLPHEVFRARLRLAVGMVLTGIANPDYAIESKYRALFSADYYDDLISMASAALKSPWSRLAKD